MNGTTLHSRFGLEINLGKELSRTKEDILLKDMRRCLLLIVDEQSLISGELLSACKRNLSKTIYGGLSSKEDFGGIPVVMLCGDDSQLPPIIRFGKGKGAFYVFENKVIYSRKSVEIQNE